MLNIADIYFKVPARQRRKIEAQVWEAEAHMEASYVLSSCKNIEVRRLQGLYLYASLSRSDRDTCSGPK